MLLSCTGVDDLERRHVPRGVKGRGWLLVNGHDFLLARLVGMRAVKVRERMAEARFYGLLSNPVCLGCVTSMA